MVDQFVQAGFSMCHVLICLVLGVMIAHECFWTLTEASINAKNSIWQVRETLDKDGVKRASRLCKL